MITTFITRCSAAMRAQAAMLQARRLRLRLPAARQEFLQCTTAEKLRGAALFYQTEKCFLASSAHASLGLSLSHQFFF